MSRDNAKKLCRWAKTFRRAIKKVWGAIWERTWASVLFCGLIALFALLAIGPLGTRFFPGFLKDYNEYFTGVAAGVSAVVVALLVGATIVYARAAKQQADASMRMAEAALRPIIVIDWIGPWPDTKEDTSAVFKNIGLGPALNLECYLTHDEFNFQYRDKGYTAMRVGEKHPISLRHENFDKERSGLAINCDYQSVSGEKFRSILRWESEENRSLEITKLNSGEHTK